MGLNIHAQQRKISCEAGFHVLLPNGVVKDYNINGLGVAVTLVRPVKQQRKLSWNAKLGAEQFIGTKVLYVDSGDGEIPTPQSTTWLHAGAGLRYQPASRFYVQHNLALVYISKTGSSRVNLINPGWHTTVGVLPLKWLTVEASFLGFRTTDDTYTSFSIGLSCRF